MAERSWSTTKKLVYDRAGGFCEYCQTYGLNIGQALHIEHINPDGGDHLDNLCSACPNCNLSKATARAAWDTETNQEVSLFNPRHQKWSEHFEWVENHTQIRGLTATGRATVARLQMNRSRIILTRQRWVQAGLHPVIEDH
jgi:hypothetical protein